MSLLFFYSHQRNLIRRLPHRFLMLFGYIMSVGMFGLLFYVFLTAYFGGLYRTTIDINRYGEAHFELMFLTVLFILSVVGLYYFIKK